MKFPIRTKNNGDLKNKRTEYEYYSRVKNLYSIQVHYLYGIM